MSVDTIFTVLFRLLIISAFIAALFYTKTIDKIIDIIRCYIRGNALHTPYDTSNTTSNRETEGFSRQKYVVSNLPAYGVCNMGTSLDEREIHRYEYSRMGLQSE